MNLAGALDQLKQLDGLVAAVLTTHDGLPVEQVGSRFAAESIAAELTGLAEAARNCFASLDLGDVRHLSVALTAHEVTLVMVPGHLLALIFERGSGSILLAPAIERALQPLRTSLGGRQ